MTTECAQRVQALEDILYGIDFTCRSSVDSQQTLKVVQDLCAAANVRSVEISRKMNAMSADMPMGTR